jgi:hypothetical protein
MKWHPFKAHTEYRLSEIVTVLRKDLESGRLTDIDSKYPLIEKFEASTEESAVFTPFGGAWGWSPHNPNAWKKKDGTDLIVGYRQPRQRKPFSKKTRLEVMRKTDSHCYSCGQKFTSESEVWIEHITAFSNGGSDEPSNLLPGCRICNYTRRNFTPHQIQRILSIGAALVREVDQESTIGLEIFSYLERLEAKRKLRRKSDYGFLVFRKPEKATTN